MNNKIAIEVLTTAKDYLALAATGKYTYLCNAVSAAGRATGHRDVANDIAELIAVRLGDCSSLRNWLIQIAGIPAKKLTYTRVQAHRLAWINELIKEFS